MSSAESGPRAGQSKTPQVTGSSKLSRVGLWRRELPYALVLILTLLGVAYTSYFKQPIMAYWALLAPLIGVICVSAGWRTAQDKDARIRLIWTQALHWFAFLVVMSVMMLPSSSQGQPFTEHRLEFSLAKPGRSPPASGAGNFERR